MDAYSTSCQGPVHLKHIGNSNIAWRKCVCLEFLLASTVGTRRYPPNLDGTGRGEIHGAIFSSTMQIPVSVPDVAIYAYSWLRHIQRKLWRCGVWLNVRNRFCVASLNLICCQTKTHSNPSNMRLPHSTDQGITRTCQKSNTIQSVLQIRWSLGDHGPHYVGVEREREL